MISENARSSFLGLKLHFGLALAIILFAGAGLSLFAQVSQEELIAQDAVVSQTLALTPHLPDKIFQGALLASEVLGKTVIVPTKPPLNNTIVVKTESINLAQLQQLMDTRISQWQALGRFKGEKGDKGDQGPAGFSPYFVLPANPSANFNGATVFSATDLSGSNVSANKLTVTDASSLASLTVSGVSSLATANISTLNVSGSVGVGNHTTANTAAGTLAVAGQITFGGVTDASAHPSWSTSYGNWLSTSGIYGQSTISAFSSDPADYNDSVGNLYEILVSPAADIPDGLYPDAWGTLTQVRTDASNTHLIPNTTVTGSGLFMYDPKGYDSIHGLEVKASSQANTDVSTIIGGYLVGASSGGGNVTASIEGAEIGGIKQGAGDVTEIDGALLYATHGGTGTVTDANALWTRVSSISGGTIVNGYNLYMHAPTFYGTGSAITNQYGLYVANQYVAGKTTNAYNIYSAGSTSKNYFEGKIGIGTTTPVNALSVIGSISSSALNITNGVVYTDNTGKLLVTAQGGAGTLCLVSTAGGTPTWAACSGSAATAWSSLTAPSANLSVSMSSYTTTFTYGNATGANNLFTLTDTANNTGTGTLFKVTTANGSAVNPLSVTASGTPALTVLANGNVGIGTSIPANILSVQGTSNFTGHMAVGNIAQVNAIPQSYGFYNSSSLQALTVSERATGVGSDSRASGIASYLVADPSASTDYNGYYAGNFQVITNQNSTANIPNSQIVAGNFTAMHNASTTIRRITGGNFYAGNEGIGTPESIIGISANAANDGTGTGFISDTIMGADISAGSYGTNNADTLFGLSSGIYASGYGLGSPGIVNNGYGVRVYGGTDNNARLNNLYNIYVYKAWASSGSYIGNNYGLFIDNQNAGSLLNYSIYTNQAASSTAPLNSFTMYNNGTAPSYFNGNIGIASTTPSAQLTIQGVAASPTTPLLTIASSSGSTLLTVLPNGNVGIGTSSPTQALAVNGNLYLTGSSLLGSTASATGISTVATGNHFNGTFIRNQGVVSSGQLRSFSADANDYSYTTGTLNEYVVNPDTDIPAGLYPWAVGQMTIIGNNPSSTKAMPNASIHGERINAYANNYSNLYTFNVVRGLDAQAYNYAKTDTVQGIGGYAWNYSNTTTSVILGGHFLALSRGTGNVETMKAVEVWNDFIGTSAVTDAYGILINSSVGGNRVQNNYGLYIADQSGFGTVKSYNMYSAGSASKNYFEGKISIASTTPSAQLTIQGVAASPTTPLLTIASSSGSTLLTVLPNGNVGIGTTTPGYLLYVYRATDGDVAAFRDANGTCTINPTNTALVCSSDARLKKDVTDMQNVLDKLAKVRAVDFKWLNQTDDTAHFGFIAQELETVFPELVSSSFPDGYKSVAYTNFVPILTKAIQEQQDQIQALKLQIQGTGQNTNQDNLSVVTTTFQGNLSVKGHLYLSSDSIGQAKILTGATSTRITFTAPYEYQPVVTITPLDKFVPAFVTNVDATGFTIAIDTSNFQIPASDFQFYWHAFASPEAKLTVSDGSVQNIELVVPVPPTPAAPEEDKDSPEVLGQTVTEQPKDTTDPSSIVDEEAPPKEEIKTPDNQTPPAEAQDQTPLDTGTETISE